MEHRQPAMLLLLKAVRQERHQQSSPIVVAALLSPAEGVVATLRWRGPRRATALTYTIVTSGITPRRTQYRRTKIVRLYTEGPVCMHEENGYVYVCIGKIMAEIQVQHKNEVGESSNQRLKVVHDMHCNSIRPEYGRQTKRLAMDLIG